MQIKLDQKVQLRFEGGEYFGPFVVDAICHHVQEDEYTYFLVKEGEIQPCCWFHSSEVLSHEQ